MIAGVTHDPADFVWAGSVLHCMPEEDCRAFLNSAYQLLKPGGFLYGMTAGKHESTEWTYSTGGTLKGFLYSPVLPLHISTLYTCTGLMLQRVHTTVGKLQRDTRSLWRTQTD